jgi:DEAD/DEAH box helicase domain-containing protein
MVIGAVDHGSAPRLLHDGAIYLHEGQSYVVQQLDLEQSLAHVRAVDVDYYTDVVGETEVTELDKHEQLAQQGSQAVYGELRVTQTVKGYRRVKRFTHETLGLFPLDYPPQVVETSGYWCSILPETQASLEASGEWHDSVNDYGPNWAEQRQQVRVRDNFRCTQCGALETPGRQHDVHHLTPFRTYGYVPGVNEHYKLANRLSNLTLLCRGCHLRVEAGVRVRSGLDGMAYALSNLAPLYLMCDPQDIGVHVERTEMAGVARRLHDPALMEGQLPTIYIYERAAAGLGFSARLFELHTTLLKAAYELITNCGCPQGCPACVGPVLENEAAQLDTKRLALAILRQLTGRAHSPHPVAHPKADVSPNADVDF